MTDETELLQAMAKAIHDSFSRQRHGNGFVLYDNILGSAQLAWQEMARKALACLRETRVDVRWRPMTEEPKPRERVLLLTNLGISSGEWVRSPFNDFRYAFQCECGWFAPTYFSAWMPKSELMPTQSGGEQS